ncbi:hypothetical protein Z951_32915 [Streptomyces sp. PRh5]|nr:hypothetical protein Z951_32915 [Streptomyces sp. PRh5]
MVGWHTGWRLRWGSRKDRRAGTGAGCGPGSRFSDLERLRRPPTRTTGTAFARALERVDETSAFRLGRWKLSQIPPNRMAALARYALGSKAALLERAAEPKRTAMLTAVMRHL